MGERLKGRVAIVTGAASGIGREIARLYAGEGARVLAVDRPGLGLAGEFEGYEAVRCLEQDVTTPEAAERIVAAAVGAFGQLDILVNNAGIAVGADFESTTDEIWQRVMDVNVNAVFRLSRAAVPELRKRGRGRIINLGSIMSDMAGPGLCAYGTSKHAVAGLTKAMAVDLGKHRITVNCLKPGSIVTGLSKPFLDDPDFRRYWETKAPLGRLGQPADVAAAALFLASDEADFVTGAGVSVDGGALVNF